MQWSKLKKKIEAHFCDELKNRVELFSTWYKSNGSPERGRAVVLIDRLEVYEACTDKWIMDKRNKDEKKKNGIISRNEFHDLLEEYLNSSIEEAILSKNILVRGLSMIDRRLGKRRLEIIEINDKDHIFIKKMYRIRCDIEWN